MSGTTAPHVTIANYVRAESDFQLRGYIEKFDCFGRLVHSRAPYDVHNQVTVRGNRDTLYSFGVFDLTSPLTVRLPDPGNRYQSLMTVSQDHSIDVHYSPAEVTITAEAVGTRYGCVTVRTFADPDDDDDGTLDGSDCRPLDLHVWEPPNDVRDLQVQHADATTLISWTAPSNPGTSLPLLYDTVISNDAFDFVICE